MYSFFFLQLSTIFTLIFQSVNDHAVSTLTLDDLTWEDEGDYFCNSTYSGFPQDSIQNATLYIRGMLSAY